MRSNNYSFWFIIVIAFFVALLVVLYSVMDNISLTDSGFSGVVEQVAKGLVVLGITWIIIRFFEYFVWKSYQGEKNSYLPRIIINIFNVIIIILAVVFVTTNIGKQSPWSVTALLFGPGVGLGFALKDLLHDVLAGIVLTIDQQFKRGHYISCEDYEGQIIDIHWHNTSLLYYNSLLVIPNRKLLDNGFINYDLPQQAYQDFLTVTLDQDISPDRGKRMLISSVIKVIPSILVEKVEVNAIKINEGGTVYRIDYPLANRGDKTRVMHQILNSIASDLHAHGYKLSESLGEYSLSRAKSIMHPRPDIANKDHLSKVPLFSELNNEEIKTLADGCIVQHLSCATQCLQQGQTNTSMYIIIEGAASVTYATLNQKESNEKTITQLTIGDHYGGLGLLTGAPNLVTIKALSDMVVLAIDKQLMTQVMINRPNVAQEFAQYMQNRKQQFEFAIEGLKNESVLTKGDLAQHIKAFFGLL